MEKKKVTSEKTLILLSGGPDSATLAYVAEKQRKENGGGVINAIYLRTGHPSDKKEIESAQRIAKQIDSKLEIIDISDVVRKLGAKHILMHAGAPVMSFGSAVALSIATAYAIENRLEEVLIGMHKDDTAHGPEYTQEYLDRFESMTKIAGNDLIKIEAPFLNMRKYKVLKLGSQLGVSYSQTWSCIYGGEVHCGHCGACQSRRSAFILAGVDDPTEYISSVSIENLSGPFYRERAVMTI